MAAVASLTVAALLAALVAGNDAALAGQLNVISQNLSIETYTLSGSSLSRHFGAQLDASNSHLRPPCPSCQPSYDLFVHDNQILLPISERFYVFTFTSEQPYVYSQTIPAPFCDPIGITRSSLLPNQLYVDCKDLQNRSNVFLALLEQGTDDLTRLQWSFQRLQGYQSLGGAGTFVEVAALNTVMMLYVHEAYGYIEVNGVDSGFISSLSLPSGCGHLVRATPTGSAGVVLLECSSWQGSEEITNLHTFNISAAVLVHVTNTAPYTVCPLRFTVDGLTAALFTEHGITVLDLRSGDHVNVTASGVVYDGLIVRAGVHALYIVYSTPEGLYRSYASSLTSGSSQSLMFEGTSGICAYPDCSLLAMLDSDTILAALDHEIAVFSISTLHQIARASTKYQPSRYIFQRINESRVRTPVPTSSHLPPPPHFASVVPSPPPHRLTQGPSPSLLPPSRDPPSSQAPSPPPTYHQVTSSRPSLTPAPRETTKPNVVYTVADDRGFNRAAVGGLAVGIAVVAVAVLIATVVITCRKKLRKLRPPRLPSLGQSRTSGSREQLMGNMSLTSMDSRDENSSQDGGGVSVPVRLSAVGEEGPAAEPQLLQAGGERREGEEREGEEEKVAAAAEEEEEKEEEEEEKEEEEKEEEEREEAEEGKEVQSGEESQNLSEGCPLEDTNCSAARPASLGIGPNSLSVETVGSPNVQAVQAESENTHSSEQVSGHLEEKRTDEREPPDGAQ